MIPRLVVSTAIVLGVLVAVLFGANPFTAPDRALPDRNAISLRSGAAVPKRAQAGTPKASDPAKTANPAARACRDAIEQVYASLDQESIVTLLKAERDDLIRFHHGWGTGIRNHLGLWNEDSPIRKSCAALVGSNDLHPDNASSVVMDGVWELVHAAHESEP